MLEEWVGGASLFTVSASFRVFDHQIQPMRFQIKHKVMNLHVVGEKHTEVPVKECGIG